MLQDFVQQVEKLVTDLIADVHTAIPGTIVSFDTGSCKASVLPKGKFKTPDGRLFDYPTINDVPVVFPSGAGQKVGIAYPVKKGDGCLLIMAEQALDEWLYGGESQTDLKHDLTNSIAIPGLFNVGGSGIAEAAEKDAVVLYSGGAKVIISKEQIELSLNNSQIIVSNEGTAIRGSLTVDGNISYTGSINGS